MNVQSCKDMTAVSNRKVLQDATGEIYDGEVCKYNGFFFAERTTLVPMLAPPLLHTTCLCRAP